MLASFASDLRYSLKSLFARPLFLAIAVLSLALGIGVNTAVYSVFHQAVRAPLPVAAPERLVNLTAPGLKSGNTSNNSAGPRDAIFSYPMFRDLQAAPVAAEVFAGIAAHRSFASNLAFRGGTRSGTGMYVSGNYFSVLGLTPALGRLLQPEDDRAPGDGPVAVLAYAYWQNELGADPGVLGELIRVNGQPLTVVGVAPAGFAGTTFGTRPQVFVPISQRWSLQPMSEPDHDNRRSYWVYLFARLAPGVSLEQAATGINRPYRQLLHEVEAPLHGSLDAERLEQFKARRVELEAGARGQSSVSRNAGTPLVLLLAATALVLLIACLNIANLLLARGAARSGELAVRASIGASRGRLVRQLLIEATLLAVLGALASLPLAVATLGAILTLLPDGVGAMLQVGLDPAALRFTALLALATVLLFGLFPALQLARTEPITVLRGESGATGGSRAASRFRSGLAVAQVAFSMAALTLAGLFAQSLANLGRVELGMQVESIAGFAISPGRSGYAPARSAQLFDRLEQELAALPGVTAVTTSMVPLLSNSDWGSNVSVEGFESTPDTISPYYNSIGSGYFATLGIPLLAGRDFEAADRDGAPKVAVVNRRFADYFGLGANPVGKRMAIGQRDDLDIEIVGLVADSKYSDIKADDPLQFFLPRRQNPRLGEMNFYVRSALDPEALLALIPPALARIDRDLPIENLRTLPQQIALSVVLDHFVGTLAMVFAALATALAALGLYGVLSYTQSQRMRELGLRLALGAAPRRLRRMVLGQVGRMTVLGGVLGLAAALLIGRAAQSLLFGLEGHDPGVLAGAAGLLTVVALGAGWLPARRAGRIDPMLALRHD